jgi:Flp pilus assembly protein TadG
VSGRGGRGAGRRTEREERGSVLVEFSLVFALFVLVIYALISFGVILAAKNSLTHAAAEGARAAVAVVDDPMTADDERILRAREKVDQSLDWFGSKYESGDTTAFIAPCGTAECITVKIVYPYSTRPIVPPAPGLGLVIPSNLTSTAVVELTD